MHGFWGHVTHKRATCTTQRGRSGGAGRTPSTPSWTGPTDPLRYRDRLLANLARLVDDGAGAAAADRPLALSHAHARPKASRAAAQTPPVATLPLPRRDPCPASASAHAHTNKQTSTHANRPSAGPPRFVGLRIRAFATSLAGSDAEAAELRRLGKALGALSRRACPADGQRRDGAHRRHICAGTLLTPAHICTGWARRRRIGTGTGCIPATSAPGLGSPPPLSTAGPGLPRPHAHRDWAHPCHISTGTWLIPATSAPGPGSPPPHLHRDRAHPPPHLHRDRAHPLHICTGTGAPVHSRMAQPAVRLGRATAGGLLRRLQPLDAVGAPSPGALTVAPHPLRI